MSVGYRVALLPGARRQLEKIERKHQRQVLRRLRSLEVDPRPRGATKLRGFDAYRLRSGDHRIIYRIEDDRVLVLVLRIGYRKEIYRSLQDLE